MKIDSPIKIYHNKNCSKSCAALALLEKREEKTEIVSYLEHPPTSEELTSILKLLNLSPLELVRKNEPIFKQQFENRVHSDQEWINILIANPILIERPIIVRGDKAVIGRPIERILELLDDSH